MTDLQDRIAQKAEEIYKLQSGLLEVMVANYIIHNREVPEVVSDYCQRTWLKSTGDINMTQFDDATWDYILEKAMTWDKINEYGLLSKDAEIAIEFNKETYQMEVIIRKHLC